MPGVTQGPASSDHKLDKEVTSVSRGLSCQHLPGPARSLQGLPVGVSCTPTLTVTQLPRPRPGPAAAAAAAAVEADAPTRHFCSKLPHKGHQMVLSAEHLCLLTPISQQTFQLLGAAGGCEGAGGPGVRATRTPAPRSRGQHPGQEGTSCSGP